MYGIILIYVSIRSIVRGTLCGLYCPYFSPEVMVKFTRMVREHVVTLIEVGKHLNEGNSGYISKSWASESRIPLKSTIEM